MGKAVAHGQSNGSQLGRPPFHRQHQQRFCLSTRFFCSFFLRSSFFFSLSFFFLSSIGWFVLSVVPPFLLSLRFSRMSQKRDLTIELYASRPIIKSFNYLRLSCFNNFPFRRSLCRNRLVYTLVHKYWNELELGINYFINEFIMNLYIQRCNKN